LFSKARRLAPIFEFKGAFIAIKQALMSVACAKLGHPFDVSWSGWLPNEEQKYGKLANSRASLIFL
jgi:hypothetical protein